MSHKDKLLEGLDDEKYKVTGDGKSLTLTIFNETFGNHCYVCRTSNSSNAISCLIVDGNSHFCSNTTCFSIAEAPRDAKRLLGN